MDRLTFDIGFVHKKTAVVDGFFIKKGIQVSRLPKNDKSGKYCLWVDWDFDTRVVFKDADELWNYIVEDKTVGQWMSSQDKFNVTDDWE